MKKLESYAAIIIAIGGLALSTYNGCDLIKSHYNISNPIQESTKSTPNELEHITKNSYYTLEK